MHATHCTTGDCPHGFDHKFRAEMIEGLTELRTNMKALIGNGQPGLVGKLEHRIEQAEETLDDHAAFIATQQGGGRMIERFITAALSFVVALFGAWVSRKVA